MLMEAQQPFWQVSKTCWAFLFIVLGAANDSLYVYTLLLVQVQFQPFLQKSGIDRAKALSKTDAGIEKLLQGGVAQRLLSILEDKPDPGLSTPRLQLLAVQVQHSVQALLPAAENVSAALHTIEELSRKYEAREALVLAGTLRPAICATRLTAYYPASVVQELLFVQV